MATDKPKKPDESAAPGSKDPGIARPKMPREGPAASKDMGRTGSGSSSPAGTSGNVSGSTGAIGSPTSAGRGSLARPAVPAVAPAPRGGSAQDRSTKSLGNDRSSTPGTGAGGTGPSGPGTGAGAASMSPGLASGRGTKQLGADTSNLGGSTAGSPASMGGSAGSGATIPARSAAGTEAENSMATGGSTGNSTTTPAGSTSGTAPETSGTTDESGGRVGQALESARQAGRSEAGNAADHVVSGGSDKASRRYAGKAAAGAIDGATKGGLHGAAVGAGKEVAGEAGQDALKASGRLTGGSPVAEPADKRLGAGGTGYEQTKKEQAEEERSSKLKKRLAAGGAAAATPPAMGLVMVMALLNWLKSMFFALLALAANAANAIWMLALNVLKSAAHFVAAPFMALGGFISNAAGAVLGVSIGSTVAAGITGALTGMLGSVTAVALLLGVMDTGALQSDQLNTTNSLCVSNIKSGSDGSGAAVSANTEENAKIVYSVLKSWDMPDENIAGILGNWSQESGVDPTAVESIYNEPYQIGPRKQAAWDGNFTQIPGQEHGGIGLGQWSNGRTPMLLDYAESKGTDWFKIETQLAFMADGDNPSDVAAFKKMISTSMGSPGEAATYFHDQWERSADDAAAMAERTADAEMWFSKMSGWTVDESVADGVADISGDVVGGTSGAVTSLVNNCQTEDTTKSAGLVDGGMNEEQAQELVDLYNKEGDKFLDERYGNTGGPGSCGDNHAENCVSFSVYFVNKYTSFQEYPAGNGIETAGKIASMTGKKTSDQPTPYSVGSGPGTGPAGHTFVVLGVQGDNVIVGEAGYCSFMGRVRTITKQQLKAEGWEFVDMSDLIGKNSEDPAELPPAKAA